MHAVISLLLQSKKFWWYWLLWCSSWRHNDVIQSYCCQRYADCQVTTLCSSRTLHRHTALRTCNSWTAASRNAKLFLRPTQPVASKQPRSQSCGVWITRSGLSCSIVSTRDESIVWMNWNGGSSMSDAVLNSRFLTRLLTSGEEDFEHVSMLKEYISSTACELTMLILSIFVTFSVTCLTVTSLITKSCQQRWPIHSCLFYKQIDVSW